MYYHSAIYICSLFTFIFFLFSIVLDQNIASLRISTHAGQDENNVTKYLL